MTRRETPDDTTDDHLPGTGSAVPLRVRGALLWLVAPVTVILVFWALQATGALFVPLILSVFLALLVAPVDRAVAERMPDRFGWVGHLAAMSAILLAGLVFVGSIWIAAEQVMSQFPREETSQAQGAAAPGDALLPDVAAALLGGGGPEGDAGSATAPAGDGVANGQVTNGQVAGDQARNGGAGAGPAAADGAGPQDAGGSGGTVARMLDLIGGAGLDLGSRVADWAAGVAGNVLTAAGSILGGAALVFFLTLLLLIERDKWRSNADAILHGGSRRDARESVAVIGSRLRRYLLARTILGLMTAALYSAWLWIFGIDLLIVWALLAFLLNYVPTLGSLIAGVLPVIYAFSQKDPGTAALVAAGLLVIEQVMGNFVDPKVQGRQVALSPVVVLLALVFWGWVWGVAGLVLAVPITIAVTIVFAHVPSLRPVALLLSDKKGMEGLDRMAGRDGEG